MRMIEELFDGNIQPCERPVRDGSQLQKLASLVMKNNDALLALLDETQLARFERYKEIQNELAAQLEREAFTEGSCIGARLSFEVMEHTEIPSIDDWPCQKLRRSNQRIRQKGMWKNMAQKRLLTNGSAFKRTDDRWCGVVWYMDEQENRKRKSFSGTTKAEVNKKMTDYIAEFNKQILQSDEAKRTLQDSMQHWLQVFKFPSVERTTYDRYECTARHQIYPLIGEKVVGDIKAADLKKLLNYWMNKGYAYTTVKKLHIQLKEFFRYLVEQEVLDRNPMNSVPMIKKANYFAAQNKENLAECDAITVFTTEEIELFKSECFRTWSNGKRIYQQAGAYILMLNTGLRTGEMLGILNSDVDLENKVLHVRQGVKEIYHRNGLNIDSGRDVKVGKLKSATSKRDVPLNTTAIEMIEDLRREYYFGPCTPLVCDESGDYTRPVNFRKRYYRILEAAGIQRKRLHALRHTFATNLVNGVKQPDSTIKALTPRQVADLLGHSTSQITEQYYVKRDNSRLVGATDEFEL